MARSRIENPKHKAQFNFKPRKEKDKKERCRQRWEGAKKEGGIQESENKIEKSTQRR
jgi:hypothetical protein